MTIRVALHHKTAYRYDKPISLGAQLIRLRPAYHARTPIEAYSLKVAPSDHFVNWQQDPFGNPVARYVFPNRVKEFEIAVDLVANMTVINPFDFFIRDDCDQWPFSYDDSLKKQLAPYLVKQQPSPNLMDWVNSFPKSSDTLNNFLVDLNQRTQQRIEYLVRLEPGVQSPEETLTLGTGSCRDSAWLLVESFRQIDIAARFVSGYLIQLTADQKPLDGPSGPKDDFCDLHAWTEVYVPGAGWVGLDPTSGLLAGEGHIPLTCTPHFDDAAPVTGGHEPCEVEFSHEMSVNRIHEDPRVTLPYTDQQWAEIQSLGQKVDERLDDGDVRLTMGGEPTFVSINNMEDPQWNTEAVGFEKRVLSNLLLLRLREQFSPGGLLHYGQGKWYPGESLPRWALTCLWRRDGEPIWHDTKWLADEGVDYGFTHDDSRRFIKHLGRKLNISARMSFPVYEDTFHYLWREGQLPVDVDPSDPKLDDPNERAMMIRTFQSGLGTPVGYVLPLRRAWWQARAGWVGGQWPVRGERVFLIPGDSPIGLRLPLDTLPVGSASTASLYTMPFDPTVKRPPLPRYQPATRRVPVHSGHRGGPIGQQINEQVLDFDDDDDLPGGNDVIRTAMCIECRHGKIHVFMPPTQRLEDYLELTAAIEETCGDLQIPVILEGYLPPPDSRIELYKVTPDPGVIEVNTQPSESWDELVGLTETLYDAARKCQLGTDKFDLDGRHTGTGGGNHIVLGGKNPSDSPFLRRPDLLGSLIAFWNNHPSLSYLFSSRFIGPTSQAPRFDESRSDAVYEMEIALSQLPGRDDYTPPWMVDRLFRDLMVDLTGNTHRAEICVDKLYSPDSTTGRLGLVEFRGFEMPPHAQMSLTQQLLVRALVAAFWERPYRRKLTDWGPALYDRFMLPYFVWRDLCNVLEELREYDIDMKPEWFLPHQEFRFPMAGELHCRDMRLELRSAIEPWYVMGEEPGASGTTRFVDSSVERLELRISGFDLHRYRVLCNGVSVPLHKTDVQSQYVAGIRFRAWQPPRCLHPTIGIHSPLRFNIAELSSNRSIGCCTYHVVHPGGRAEERFPINPNEAESRRVARFDTQGLMGGLLDIPEFVPPAAAQPYPITLDLRRRLSS